MTIRRLAILCLIIIATAAVAGRYAAVVLQPARAGWLSGGGKSLMVFAGSAGQPALQQAVAMYQKQRHVRIDISYGGSGTLLTQITREHVGDLYIPGSDDYMMKAVAKGAVIKNTIRPLAYLVPTICVAKGNPKHIKGLADLARPDVRVVLAQKNAVCLGDVSEDILAQAGLTAKVHKRVASYATSCEETCNTLLMGEADAIIGWDVWGRQHPTKIQTIAIPKKYVRTRNIPGAVITWSKNKAGAQAFLAYLTGPSGKYIFKSKGYTVR